MTYPMSGSYLSSPDQPSSVYPDRLIRPLPRRTIKSRLSLEATESISFPPNPPSTTLPLYTQYNQNGEYLSDNKVHIHQNSSVYDQDDVDEEDQCPHHHQHCDHDHDHDHDIDEDDLDSADDLSPEALRHSNLYRASPRSPRSRHTRYGSYGGKAGSSAPDGYEAFENTNNKKKRKIPTSGSLSLHHTSIASDLASHGVGGTRDGTMEEGGYYGSPSPSSSGIQGATKVRGTRKSLTRNPLGVSINGSNVRSGPTKYDQNINPSTKPEDAKPDQGIISAAIANATALLSNPLSKGQENVGVLDQQARAPPTNSQFTFTCESESKGVKFPEQSLYSPDYNQRVNPPGPLVPGNPHQKFSTQGTQTSPDMQSQHNQQSADAQQTAGPDVQGRKSRRRKGDVYALAARQRKLQQEYMNLQHPPASEDIWICEFCEYESIFGAPPRALIRQYEIKDRRERKRLAEKQRLLEKAKLKGRKGKKQTKNAAKAASQAAQQSSNQQAYDQQQLDPMGEDYLDDGYDDDPTHMPAPAPQPAAKPQQMTMPGSYNSDANVSKAGGGTDKGGIR